MSDAAAREILFDAVLFDLDGTLVSTELFWVEAARTGARRAFEELGLEREMPSAEEWLSMVGLPLEEGFRNVFADLERAQRARVMVCCVEEEEAALRAGGAALMSGALELLASLAEEGVQLGIASNCGRGYLDSMVNGLGLCRYVSEARCLDSAGVRNKADMIADLLETFGTRSAVMVGDRRGDAEAAHANGLPHVHLSGPIKPRAERVPCEATIGELGQLREVLGRRREWIEAELSALGLFGPGADGIHALGITGGPGAGKTLFARDVARVLRQRGRPARVSAFGGGDVEGLLEGVLEPHASGLPVVLGGGPLPPGALLILEGEGLLEPRLRLALDRTVYLDGGTRTGPASGDPPPERADRVLDASSPLGPAHAH